MNPAVVIGTTFVDIKGFARGSYDPLGRNLGEVQLVHGGVGRNVVENFANVGMPVAYVGMLDNSAIGQDVERHLAEIGTDLRWMMRVPDRGIGMWLVILDEKGELAGSISKMPDITQLEGYLKEHGGEIVSQAEAVVLEVDLNETIAEMIIRLANKHGKDVYSIVGNMSVILARRDLMRQTKCFICNEVEAAKFFGESFSGLEREALLSRLPELAERAGLQSVVVTLGERGAAYYEKETGRAGWCPPCPTEVVDTTGAGDAFFSGTVMGLIRGNSLGDAAAYGARLASETISRNENSCPVNKNFFDQ